MRQITFTDAQTSDEVIEEHQDAGLLVSTGEALSLRDAPELQSDLDMMPHFFDDPNGRQALPRRMYWHAAVSLLGDSTESRTPTLMDS
ncbi:MAG: hypothetical protein OXH73_09995 [Caldilineaceae bacterium]|nr:hypothetical protein [Caldilineaceae bacterium]